MNIHEYQAKALFAEYGVPVLKGVACQSPEEFDAAVAELPEGIIVVKSQIHAGGRGKGTFTDGYKGGVKLAKTPEEAKAIASRMLGNTLVTVQTGPAGRKVQTVYFNEGCDIGHEYYLSLTLDRGSGQYVIIASTEGGVDIETVAHETPEKIVKIFIDPVQGLQGFHLRSLAFGLEMTDKGLQKQLAKTVKGLYAMFTEKDCDMLEVNPLITTKDDRIIALDAKVGFDSNALFRHPEILALRDLAEEDPKEIEAGKHGLAYIALDGNIACLVNGAGLAMSTMDIIQHYGGTPANFLDVGGGASEEAVTEAFKIILSDPKVEGILVNIFGGIMSCARIARGVIAAAQNVEITVPLVVRLEGNEVAEGKKLLEESGLALQSADSLADGAQKIVAAVKAA